MRRTAMKRGAPLRAGKPLERGTPLRATAPMPRRPRPACTVEGCEQPRYSGGLCARHHLDAQPREVISTAQSRAPRKARASGTPAREGVSAEVRAIVLARAAGRCEACARPFGAASPHLHHRARRRGGDHRACNLVALHPECHVLAPGAVHQEPSWARERGLIVRSTEDPASAPLVLASGARVLLGEEYLPCAA